MDNLENRKTLASVLVLVALLAGLVTWGESRSDKTAIPASTESSQEIAISYPGKQGRTALDLLKSSYEVQTQQYTGLGEFVTSIDGRKADSNQFWGFYVNGEMSQVGAHQYITNDTDTITWKLETAQ